MLVVCQLSGGNDGLNTVVPYASASYYQLRPTLAIKDSETLKLNEAMGLHPNMTGVHELYKEGKVAIVQNVGYPEPNRSHFKSMDICISQPGRKIGDAGRRHFDLPVRRGR